MKKLNKRVIGIEVGCRACYLLALFILVRGVVMGQNLVPDPGFQQNNSTDCDWPAGMLETASYWYSISGTSDWFDSNCSVMGTPNGFWSGEANSGYVGSISLLNFSGYFRSEAFGTPLLGAVEEGKYYYLAMRARNKGIDHPDHDSLLQNCPIDPVKSIEVLIGSDSLFTELGVDGEVVSVNHSPFYSFTASFLSEAIRGQWQDMYTCLEAPTGGSHLGISLPFGPFEMEAPCAASLNSVIYHMYYQDVDDVELIQLPDLLEQTINQCDQAEGIAVRVDTLFDFRLLEVEYEWSDGFVGAERVVQEPGEYEIWANLPCTSIPIRLSLTLEDCVPKVFVPNAFSPNDDGINDRFGPFIEVDFPIQSYQFQVFDRWGNQVFVSTDSSESWNGNAYGRALPVGVYAWSLDYSIENPDGLVRYQEMGDVLVIR